MKKKGQVTIFIIIAIIIVGAVAAFFALRDSLNTGGIPASIEPIHTNIISCLEDTSEEGLVYLSLHGGYYEVPKETSILYFTEDIPYYYLNSKKYVPSIETVEEELEKYVSENLDKCLDLDIFREQGFNITERIPSISTAINEENIIIKMVYPLLIEKGRTKTQLKDFKIELDSNLKILLDASKEVVNSYSEKPSFICLTCLENISNRNYVEIKVTPIQDVSIFEENNIIWFSISNKNDYSIDKLNWMFIVEQ